MHHTSLRRPYVDVVGPQGSAHSANRPHQVPVFPAVELSLALPRGMPHAPQPSAHVHTCVHMRSRPHGQPERERECRRVWGRARAWPAPRGEREAHCNLRS
jgi:hypothetical protein